ncbi:MAG TPA: metallopeptidase TldD-related protein [Terriglobales bacterium]
MVTQLEAGNPQLEAKANADLKEIAVDLVQRALKAGATAAEAVGREGSEFSSLVRLGEVETLKESGAKALGLRVFLGQRAASVSSSDFSLPEIERMVAAAVELARVTSEDPYAGLPDSSLLGSIPGDLDLYYDDVYSLSTADRIDYARRAEAAAMNCDPRIKNSDGGSFDAATGRKVLANSLGFVGEYRRSYCSVAAMPIAQTEDGSMQRDAWYSVARSLGRLESPEQVGQEAARRTLRRLGARRVPTQRVPIVFDSTVSRSLIDHIFEAANGDVIYRHASYLTGKLGEKIAGENITIIDDGTIPGGFGTSPFDGEGVPTRRTVVVERGVLKNYLLNSYTAKKLGMQTTGNAARGLAGNPGIGSGNFFLEKGSKTPQEIIREVKNGFYLTEFLGFGVNLVTGDYSRGASGIWIENGELTYPVEEITVAGSLKEMFMNIVDIGNDLEWRGSTACPTLRIDGMMIAGA